jgi:hypothetical protein
MYARPVLVETSLARRVAPVVVLLWALGGCEAVLGLGPEPEWEQAQSTATTSTTAASTSSSATTASGVTSSTGDGGKSDGSTATGGDGGDGGSTSLATGGGGSSPSYVALVTEDAPVFYLRLGDAELSVAVAEVGSDGDYVGEPGELELGEVGAIAGDPDTAVLFHGGGVDMGDVYDPSGNKPFTCQAWVKPLEAGVETTARRAPSTSTECSPPPT